MNAEDVRRQLAEARAALRDSQRVNQDMLRAWAAAGGPLLHTGRIPDGATPHDVAAAVKDLVDSHAIDVNLVEGLNVVVAKLEDERDRLRDENARLRAAIEPLRPYRVAIRANDDLFAGDEGLADAILGAVAAIDAREGT